MGPEGALMILAIFAKWRMLLIYEAVLLRRVPFDLLRLVIFSMASHEDNPNYQSKGMFMLELHWDVLY